MKTIEQEFARKIYDQVDAFNRENPKAHSAGEKARKKYGAMAHKLPILVRTAGLAQALAFADSRDKVSQQLLEHLAKVVGGYGKDDLLRASRDAELQEYTYLTRRTMLALKWYKRFAESVLEVSATDRAEEIDGTNS